ncbi:DUF2163 domain-containing protein [Sneathiella glossodoripedis]|uniref:DUF2163 domain-containing protein n=1 Tax=Sneathiella glossodoripedis TaxID=418853 RepID=UPI00046ED855|nr:DUF2163 domain-containing protein [Sneathiella glossodoripedis]
MKPISAEMEAHLAGDVSSLCSCWRIVRGDGVEICLTDHDQNIEFEGKSYLSSDGYDRSALKNSVGLTTDETEIVGLISSNWLAEADLQNGAYDNAEIFYFLVNWQDLSMGSIELRRGRIGEVRWSHGQFSAELRGLGDAFRRQMGHVITPGCRADLGDGACTVPLEALGQDVSIKEVLSDYEFELEGYLASGHSMVGGLLRFGDGANAGRSFEIIDFDGALARARLFTAPPELVQINDGARLYPGCDKRFATCRDVFANVENFRGFPHVPGLDALLEPADG